MRILLALALALFSLPALAQSTAERVTPGYLSTTGCPNGSTVCFVPYGGKVPTGTGTYTPVSGGQMALAVATATTLTVPAGATVAQICVETAGVRYRDDGVNATASVGMPVAAGSCFQYAGSLSAINFTAQSGSPTLDVLYYK